MGLAGQTLGEGSVCIWQKWGVGNETLSFPLFFITTAWFMAMLPIWNLVKSFILYYISRFWCSWEWKPMAKTNIFHKASIPLPALSCSHSLRTVQCTCVCLVPEPTVRLNPDFIILVSWHFKVICGSRKSCRCKFGWWFPSLASQISKERAVLTVTSHFSVWYQPWAKLKRWLWK